jgi:hypothetical protein
VGLVWLVDLEPICAKYKIESTTFREAAREWLQAVRKEESGKVVWIEYSFIGKLINFLNLEDSE